ncbi:3-methyl-2-oxobutanoate hydroxymethyltransferase [Viridibacillus sp. YIM B01967]|uniref:3-methyl-2-oxobutanoate hydroxymethyltransferase n=1 Tax=Viridibacillus soli TaxID=2798301 RepID=A0ABS1HBQ1_9BACL|nr:3-methyl-2-oxobutanoate hydroxymethyltransferase [Viridibacillus soli]MBK3496746.1 3-methyl-2-oxobutanoate hydroxymethyltransferase [Viridibacillus soli]
MKTTIEFLKMKEQKDKIVMLTAYDFPSAKLAEEEGVDMILVGDSLGMVVLGYDSTVPVTVADMVHHAKAVKRGAKDTFIVVDMPFGSYHGNLDRTLQTAIEMFQQTGASALKVEGADDVVNVISSLVSTGIPVIAHLGLLPQSAAVLGGYKVQGKTADAAEKLIQDALKVEAAGACAVVIECIPYQLAAEITKVLKIPVIGIGAGADVDGQVLVYHDVLAYGTHHVPKFVETFAPAGELMRSGIESYTNAVKNGSFPKPEHRFTMADHQLEQLYGGIKK